MSMTLAEALKQVHLEPGRTYRERVDGMTVEVELIADPPTDEAVIVTAHVGGPFPMKPVVNDEPDLAPGCE